MDIDMDMDLDMDIDMQVSLVMGGGTPNWMVYFFISWKTPNYKWMIWGTPMT